MNWNNDILFSPFQLKRFHLKNRIGLAPMTRMSSPGDSIPRQDVLDFLVRRAKNGAAIVYTEAIVTDYESAQGYPGQARMITQRQIEAWKPVVQAIQKEGAIAMMQMIHCGRMAWPEVNPARRVIAPSPLTPRQKNPLTDSSYPLPDEMSQFDIEHVIVGFGETARGGLRQDLMESRSTGPMGISSTSSYPPIQISVLMRAADLLKIDIVLPMKSFRLHER